MELVAGGVTFADHESKAREQDGDVAASWTCCADAHLADHGSILRQPWHIVALNSTLCDEELFHGETLSEHGVYAGRDRNQPDGTRLVLRSVSEQDLDRMARFFWVESIEPLR